MLLIVLLVALLVLLAFGLIASLNWLAITAAVLFAATLAVAYVQHRRHHTAPARHSNVTDLDPNTGYRNGQLDDPRADRPGDPRNDT